MFLIGSLIANLFTMRFSQASFSLKYAKAISVFAMVLGFSIGSWAADWSKVTKASTQELIDSSLSYLLSTQIKQTQGQDYFRGEWPSYMVNGTSLPFNFLGKVGYTAYDSNCFVSMSIHNILAALFLEHGYKDANMVKMINESIHAISGCYNNGEFNFWHEVRWSPEVAAKYPPEMDIPRRNPNHYNLRIKWFYNFANIANDSDDTANGFLALHLNDLVNQQTGSTPLVPKPERIGFYFDRWIDSNRTNHHLFDLTRIRPISTGAFLTWFGEESPFIGPHLLIERNITKQELPSKTNDVDCIVNANVLTALAEYDELGSTKAVKDSCNYLNFVGMSDWHRRYCGTYYPNELNVPYTYSKAYASGATCLEDSKIVLVQLILKRQNGDGSFKGMKDNSDSLHSTIYAVTALLNYYKNMSVQQLPHNIRIAILKGTNFLISNAVLDEQGAHWKAGVFFSAGRAGRSLVYWMSSPYTTALVIELLAKVRAAGIYRR